MIILNENLKNNNEEYNGRINLFDKVGEKLSMQDKILIEDKSTDYREALNGGWEKNLLSDVFFCKENIDIIQNGIRSNIYNHTQKVIDIQPYDKIKIVMRSIYLQNAKNIADDITHQVKLLNEKVINECVCKIMGELNSYIKYRKDVSTLAKPMNRPKSTYVNQSLVWRGHFKKNVPVTRDRNNISRFFENNVKIQENFKPLV
jgi:hypothetical protein